MAKKTRDEINPIDLAWYRSSGAFWEVASVVKEGEKYQLSFNAKCVYMFLYTCQATFRKSSGMAYPNLDQIALALGCSDGVVKRGIDTLHNLGLIRIARGVSKSGKSPSNSYNVYGLKELDLTYYDMLGNVLEGPDYEFRYKSKKSEIEVELDVDETEQRGVTFEFDVEENVDE